ncbi:minor capsid protein [Microbaculum marinum]|uniref:Minor capsid protein n=1 Tax=Microbaculum marinum TaxID=1764581 RepID=A0AAW9RPD0_9HYPH
MARVNETIYDLEIRHQVGLWRLGTATVRDIIALLNTIDADMVDRIRKYDFTEVSGAWSRKRLERMLEAIRETNREAYRLLQRRLTGDLTDLAKYEAAFQGRLIGSSLGFKWDIVQPSAEQLKAAVTARPFQGKLLREWVSEMETGRYIRLRDAIRIGFTEGESIDQIVRRIRGTRAAKYRDGVLDISRRSGEAMVRTAVNHTATAARNELFEQNSDLIKGVQWVSTLDSRTTEICMARDGKVYKLGSGPRPPAHINCRSTIVPVTKSFRELGIDIDEVPPGTRASMNGQVAQQTTYPAWLRNQPREVVEEALGPTKAKLFLDGKLPIDRFVDPTGHAYTLDELRRREANAFAKAGIAA